MRDIDYTIDKAEVLRYLGYRGQTLDNAVNEKTDAMINLCLERSAPNYVYRVFDIKQTEGGVLILQSETLLTGKDIKRHLEGAGKCAVMAATIGAGVERELNMLEHRDMPGAVIFNAACTALAESVADRCCEEIKEYAAEKGFTVGTRYSPGYGDLPLETQRDIIGLLDASRRLGLTLTPAMLMIPRKSITAFAALRHK